MNHFIVLFILLQCVTGFAGNLPFPLSDTGVKLCYGNQGSISFPRNGEAFFGQDAMYQGIEPNYKDNGDGTVTDLVTGLIWQKTPDKTRRTYAEAMKFAKNMKLAGHSDWRVPNIKELFSIVNFTGNMKTRTPYINTKYFDFSYPEKTNNQQVGNRDMDAQFWSSNIYSGTTMKMDISAFGFNFADGRIKSYRINAEKYVRYVRGRVLGNNIFVDNGDQTITDKATGLMWTKQDSGKSLNWEEALKYAEDLDLAGYKDWRLPNVKELQSIVDYSKSPDSRNPKTKGPAINSIFNLTYTESWFWSSTTHAETLFGYYVTFGQAFSEMVFKMRKINAHGAGAVRSDPKAGDPNQWKNGLGPQKDQIRVKNFVRCVRGGTAKLITQSQLPNFNLRENLQPLKPNNSEPINGNSLFQERFINRLDKNHDQKISINEFDGPGHHFNKMDKDRDGVLKGNEIPKRPPMKRK